MIFFFIPEFPPPLSQTPACCPRSPDPPGSPGNPMKILDSLVNCVENILALNINLLELVHLEIPWKCLIKNSELWRRKKNSWNESPLCNSTSTTIDSPKRGDSWDHFTNWCSPFFFSPFVLEQKLWHPLHGLPRSAESELIKSQRLKTSSACSVSSSASCSQFSGSY